MPSSTRTHDVAVLIAEDNAINRTVAQALLAGRGLHTAIAHDGREAVELATRRHFDAIFMDCNLPEVDGYEATRQIRDALEERHVPIIAMTALSMPIDREVCLAAGMDDFISKPLQNEELDRVILRWLPAAGSDARQAAQDGDLAGGGAGHAGAELLDEGVVDGLESALSLEQRRRLIATFEAQLERGLADLESAVQRGDAAELRRVAELLKGSSATFGANRVRLRCVQLENSARWSLTAIGAEQLEELRAAAEDTVAALRRLTV